MIVENVLLRIDILCKQLGITKEELYRKAGITSAAFSQWRTGRSTPSFNSIAKIASVLNVSADYLISGYDDAPRIESIKKDPPQNGESMNSAMQLMSELGDCTPSEVSATLAFVKLLKSQRNQ